MMVIFTVYWNPSDFRDKYVVRRWDGVVPDQAATAVTETLDEARAAIPQGLSMFARHRDDDPAIVEIWL